MGAGNWGLNVAKEFLASVIAYEGECCEGSDYVNNKILLFMDAKMLCNTSN